MRGHRFALMLVVSTGIVGLFAAPVLWHVASNSYQSWRGEVRARRASETRLKLTQLNRLPPPLLPVRPIDFMRYPRQGFGFHLETDRGFVVDSDSGIVTKDMVYDSDTTVRVAFTPGEVDRIYRKAIEVRFFDLPEPHPPYPYTGPLFSTSGTHVELSLRAGRVSKQIRYDTSGFFGSLISDDWKRIWLLERLIRDTVEAKSEYRSLPEPRGMYID